MKSLIPSLFVVVLLLVAGCQDPYEGSTYQVYQENPIASFLAAEEEYTEWVKVLTYADMFNALNQADQDFTAFVPMNEAVQAFYQRMGVTQIEDLGKEYARSMVLYHTMLDTISVQEFINASWVSNLSGDKLSITIDSVNAGQAILNGEARVVKMGLHTSNGLVYVLQDAMRPLVETVFDRMNDNPDYSLFAEVLIKTGWADSLSRLADTLYVDGQAQVSQRQYTLLAVSNATFAQDGIASYDALKQLLQAGDDVTLPTNALNQYVAYHLLEGSYDLDKLLTFSGSDTSAIWDTEATDQVLMITWDSLAVEPYSINLLGTKASFDREQSNVMAKNGYVHAIDGYLPVWEPQQATVVWDLANFAEVRSLVPSDIYQPTEAVSSETKVNISDAACYTTEVSASGIGGTTYSYLTYVTCKANLKKAQFFDRLVLNLGYMGSVAMKTPTLVKGKYKVTLNFIYLSDHAFMKNMTDGNGGLMKVSFDGDNIRNVSPYTTVTSSIANIYEYTLYDEIEFNTTSSHQFKLVVMDPSASTNSKFSIQLDNIIFTPITGQP
jgi:uncharacterized surface protein with fasciclin (FAS1) repeats